MRQGELSACSNSVDMLARLGNGPAVPTIVFHGDPQCRLCHCACRITKLQGKIHRGRVPGGHAYTARSIPTRTGGRSLNAGTSTERGTLGREVAPPAHTPIRAGRTPRGRCCASSSITRAPWAPDSRGGHGALVCMPENVRPFGGAKGRPQWPGQGTEDRLDATLGAVKTGQPALANSTIR